MKAKEFDEQFDRGEDVTSALDLSSAWMVESLDREAKRLGVPRQSIIKIWIAERLEQGRNPAA